MEHVHAHLHQIGDNLFNHAEAVQPDVFARAVHQIEHFRVGRLKDLAPEAGIYQQRPLRPPTLAKADRVQLG